MTSSDYTRISTAPAQRHERCTALHWGEQAGNKQQAVMVMPGKLSYVSHEYLRCMTGSISASSFWSMEATPS